MLEESIHLTHLQLIRSAACRPVAMQRRQNKRRVQPLLCSRRIKQKVVSEQRFGKCVPAETNTHATIEEMFKAAFSVVSAPRLYSEDPRP
jgi:hypothetical protein